MKRTALKRGPWQGTLKRTRVKAKRSEPRRGPMRDKGYRDWIANEPCIACMNPQPDEGSYACHTVNNGGSSKGPDSSCIPLCRYHHDEMDGRLSTVITKKIAFAEKYGLNLAAEAARHYAEYQKEKA